MKILLVYPYFVHPRVHAEELAAPPMGLYYIGAMLCHHGHDVQIANWHDMAGQAQKIQAALTADPPDVIGFSVLHANRWGALQITRMARQHCPRSQIVFGGIGATFLWDLLLRRFDEVDYIICGEGEHPFLQLVRWIQDGAPGAPEHISGLAYRRDGRICCNAQQLPVADLDTLPNPARYFTYQHLSLTRGCPHGCTFCGSPRFWGRKVRAHSAGYVLEQMELLYRKGVSFFFIADDTFTLQRDRVIELCRQIIDRRLPVAWSAISRVDAVDETLLSWMRRAGCIQISYGVESGSPAIRRRLGKRLDNEQIEKAFGMTMRYGIMARAYFIYGAPGENDETIAESLALIAKIRPLSVIFYILDLFPGTALYDDYCRRQNIDDEIWLQPIEDILYFETDPALSKEKILAWGKALREGFQRMLPEFVRALDLVDDPALYPLHADFLSRLGMTFDHGEYAQLPVIENPGTIAQTLYLRALKYHPDARAFLGLGISYQKNKKYLDSIEILQRGRRFFPQDRHLVRCLAVSLRCVGDHSAAAELEAMCKGEP